MTLHKNYINGEWVEGKDAKDNINPSDLSDIIGSYAQASKADAEAAIAAAKAAQPGWGATTPQQRADILEAAGVELLARKDEIGMLLAREEGKPDEIFRNPRQERTQTFLRKIIAAGHRV